MEKEKILEEIRNSIGEREEKDEEANIVARNRKRKNKPTKYPIFQEYFKQRLREGNPVQAYEVEDLFKEAFKGFFENIFQSELEDELGYTKYEYKMQLKLQVQLHFRVYNHQVSEVYRLFPQISQIHYICH